MGLRFSVDDREDGLIFRTALLGQWQAPHLPLHASLDGYRPPETPSFADVAADHWAYKHIEYCAEKDVVRGYPGGYHLPSNAVTRAQMAVYVARAFDLSL